MEWYLLVWVVVGVGYACITVVVWFILAYIFSHLTEESEDVVGYWWIIILSVLWPLIFVVVLFWLLVFAIFRLISGFGKALFEYHPEES